MILSNIKKGQIFSTILLIRQVCSIIGLIGIKMKAIRSLLLLNSELDKRGWAIYTWDQIYPVSIQNHLKMHLTVIFHLVEGWPRQILIFMAEDQIRDIHNRWRWWIIRIKIHTSSNSPKKVSYLIIILITMEKMWVAVRCSKVKINL